MSFKFVCERGFLVMGMGPEGLGRVHLGVFPQVHLHLFYPETPNWAPPFGAPLATRCCVSWVATSQIPPNLLCEIDPLRSPLTINSPKNRPHLTRGYDPLAFGLTHGFSSFGGLTTLHTMEH